VRTVLGSLAAHDDFIARHGQVDPHVEWRTFVPMCRRFLDDYVAAGYVIVEALQPLDVFSHTSLDGRR
jgi:hypothetical protein